MSDHTSTDLTVPGDAVDNILKAATSGRTPFLKFKKNHFHINGVEIPLGTEYFAFCGDWRRGWRKWKDDAVFDDRMVRVAENITNPVERDSLDDDNKDQWPTKDGEKRDPWCLENQLPLENAETGERCLFTTTSFGGGLAIEILCTHWAKKNSKGLRQGLPLIKLAIGKFNTKRYGETPRPDFAVVSWENDFPDLVDVTPPKGGDMNDEVPF